MPSPTRYVGNGKKNVRLHKQCIAYDDARLHCEFRLFVCMAGILFPAFPSKAVQKKPSAQPQSIAKTPATASPPALQLSMLTSS